MNCKRDLSLGTVAYLLPPIPVPEPDIVRITMREVVIEVKEPKKEESRG